jgi:phenylacetate-CoA ligase
METMIVEVVVREHGRTRAARPGETGEVVVTDLHNLAVPLVRYVTGDLAVAHGEERCACGRGLVKIGPIEGRVAETMFDGKGNPVSGLVFSILFALLGNETKQFQIVQHADKRITLKVIVADAPALKDATQKALRDWVAKYLPGIAFAIDHVAEIPLTAAGKRKIVVIES